MSEPAWYEELPMVFVGQLDGNVLAVGRRSLPDIDCDIEHSSFNAAHQFGLSERWPLEVQSAHHTVCRTTFVVLHEVYRAYVFIELLL